MGWSCTKLAGDTMQKFFDKCNEKYGSQNSIDSQCSKFIEISGREYDDGHIAGQEYVKGRKSQRLYINPDGSIRYAPAWVKDLLM